MADKDLHKKIYEMVGAIKMARLTGNFVDAARYSLYKQLKDSKAYAALGKDWKDFCAEDLGRAQNTVNTEIKLLEEYGEPFLKAAERIGLTKKDLNVLGSGLPEDAKAQIKKGAITIGDSEFKVSEIEDNLDEFQEALAAFNKQHKETADQLKATQRVSEMHHKTIEKLHKQLDGYKKKEDERSITTDEADFLDRLEKLRTGFDGYMLRVDPERMTELADDAACTVRMKAGYIEALGYMRRQILGAYDAAMERYGNPSIAPEEAWRPGMGKDVAIPKDWYEQGALKDEAKG